MDQLANATDREQATSLLLNPRVAFAIHAVDAPNLTVERCTIIFAETADFAADDLLGAAIFLRGNCQGFRALDNSFGSTLAPTYTAIATTTIQGNFPLRNASASTSLTAATTVAGGASPAAATTAAATASPTTTAAGAAPSAAPPTAAAPAPVAAPPTAAAPAAPSRFDVPANVLSGLNLVSVLSNRAAASFAQQRTPMRATAAILAMPVMESANQPEAIVILNNSTACALGDAVIRGNDMSDLTFGTLLVAGVASLRIQDNSLTGGVAGFWLVLPDARDPQDVDTTGQFFNTIENFEEFNLLSEFATLLPLPAATAATEPTAFTGEATVFVSGNHISTGPNLAATSPPAPGHQ